MLKFVMKLETADGLQRSIYFGNESPEGNIRVKQGRQEFSRNTVRTEIANLNK